MIEFEAHLLEGVPILRRHHHPWKHIEKHMQEQFLAKIYLFNGQVTKILERITCLKKAIYLRNPLERVTKLLGQIWLFSIHLSIDQSINQSAGIY